MSSQELIWIREIPEERLEDLSDGDFTKSQTQAFRLEGWHLPVKRALLQQQVSTSVKLMALMFVIDFTQNQGIPKGNHIKTFA